MLIYRQKKGPAALEVEGVVRVGSSTKRLLLQLEPRQIIVIKHRDLDDVAAESIIKAKVRAVINAEPTMSGRYPISGGKMLLDAGIPVLEISDRDFGKFRDGLEVRVHEKWIEIKGNPSIIIPAKRFTRTLWQELSATAQIHLHKELNDFIDNTLWYAGQEKQFVTRPMVWPPLNTRIANRHVVVVVRGSGYQSDLRALKDYIADYRPVLIGVDGGADALLECGYKPDLIVGDMDSVTDGALRCGAELLVHAYPDGRAPGLERVRKLQLEAHLVPAPGTSEDIAMLLAYEKQAELIVTLGTHTHMIDFLQKGRKGMGSTLLVRMKIGSKLVDAKGVSKLYNRPFSWRRLWLIPATALFPVVMLGFIHPGFRKMASVAWYYLKLTMS